MESQDRDSAYFLAQPHELVTTGTARVAYRRYGSGDPVLFIHGWPFWGFGYRKLLPHFVDKYSCYLVDLPGAGFSEWDAGNDFSFHGHADHLKQLVRALGLRSYHIVAHDTGATVARRLAIIDADHVKKLVLINTEIPFHRPPLVEFLQKMMTLPGSNLAFRSLLRSKKFVRSKMGFRGCFVDLNLLEGEFRKHFIQFLIDSPQRMEGQIRYARGIDWQQLDALYEGHQRIKAEVLMIWGERDPFFPLFDARRMVQQFPHCRGLIPVAGCKLLPHEEKPEIVANHILDFFAAPKNQP